MDDGQLWEDMTFRGAPVAHCRAKIAHDEKAVRDRRHEADRRAILRRFR
jgi:hypothetical protein